MSTRELIPDWHQHRADLIRAARRRDVDLTDIHCVDLPGWCHAAALKLNIAEPSLLDAGVPVRMLLDRPEGGDAVTQA